MQKSATRKRHNIGTARKCNRGTSSLPREARGSLRRRPAWTVPTTRPLNSSGARTLIVEAMHAATRALVETMPMARTWGLPGAMTSTAMRWKRPRMPFPGFTQFRWPIKRTAGFVSTQATRKKRNVLARRVEMARDAAKKQPLLALEWKELEPPPSSLPNVYARHCL